MWRCSRIVCGPYTSNALHATGVGALGNGRACQSLSSACKATWNRRTLRHAAPGWCGMCGRLLMIGCRGVGPQHLVPDCLSDTARPLLCKLDPLHPLHGFPLDYYLFFAVLHSWGFRALSLHCVFSPHISPLFLRIGLLLLRWPVAGGARVTRCPSGRQWMSLVFEGYRASAGNIFVRPNPANGLPRPLVRGDRQCGLPRLEQVGVGREGVQGYSHLLEVTLHSPDRKSVV